MPTGKARSLASRYAWGVAAVTLPLLLLMGGLAAGQFAAERAARLTLVTRDMADMRMMLEALVQPAMDHIQQLRMMAEDHLTGRVATPPSPLRAALRRDDRALGVALDGLAGTPAEASIGNLHGRTDLLTRGVADPLEIDTALGLFEAMRGAHLTNPHLRWSYYFSEGGDFLVLFPFTTGEDFMRGLNAATWDDYLAAMYAYDVYRMAMPERNPERASYWTHAYLDAGGAGWMVSHAAPIYVGDRFAGMVGTDILLDFLETALARQHRPPGRVWIVDDRGHVLADSARAAGRPPDAAAIGPALPAPLAALPLDRLLEPSDRPRRLAGHEVMAMPLSGLPWHLLFVAPEGEVTALVLGRLWPYALMLGGVLATLALAQDLLRRHFVGPAIALAGRVQAQSEGDAEATAARVPAPWRPWFDAVDDAFRSSRRHLAEARDEEARKSAVLDAAFDSIITTDEEGRVLELNAGAEATFGYRRDEALGRPIGELIVPEHLRARHAEGLARYRATGERRVLGRRIEIEGLRADGTLFPVELAIAEVRLADRRLFTAYLRDITERRRAEQALQESERRYRAVVEDQTELIARYDADFHLVFCNRAYARMFGAEPEALVGQDLFHAVPAELRDGLRTNLLALTPEAPLYSGENRQAIGGGAGRWHAWSNRALFDDVGRRVGYQSVGRDITEARRIAEALRASEARFVGAAESLPDGLLILDAEDRIVFFSARHRELQPPALQAALSIGITFEDFIRDGLRHGPVYHPEMGLDYAERRLASRGTSLTEREHKHADGRWVRVREGRMPDGGRVVLTVDITARKEAEVALRQSEARYRAVVEGQTEFILRLRPDGVLTFVNDAYCRYRGLPRDVLLDGFDDVAHYPAEHRGRIRSTWAELTPARPTGSYDFELPGPDGPRHEEWTDTGIFDDQAHLVEIQSIGRDVTERRHAEAEIARQREVAHQREKLASLGSALAGVAHELNNPLSVVVGRAIMLEDKAEDPGLRDLLGRLRAAAERCARIVRTFLALARDEPRAAPQPVNLSVVLDGVLDLAYGLRSTGIEVERTDAPRLPPALADADQLAQVFLNLVINAQQALETVPPPRKLWVRTRAGRGVVRVEIADNGPGVPAELRDRVMEPFFTTKPVGAGTGLGLSVCHGIVAAYGGTIEIGDHPGGGARFVVTLPAGRRGSEAATAPPPSPRGTSGDVLVVDDEPEVVKLLEEVLAQDGHRVVTAADGVAALELLRSEPFDAVLCDVRMPGLDGAGLARELAATRPELTERLLLITGDALRAAPSLPAALRDRLLEKPLDPDEVRRRVADLVGVRPARGAAE